MKFGEPKSGDYYPGFNQPEIQELVVAQIGRWFSGAWATPMIVIRRYPSGYPFAPLYGLSKIITSSSVIGGRSTWISPEYLHIFQLQKRGSTKPANTLMSFNALPHGVQEGFAQASRSTNLQEPRRDAGRRAWSVSLLERCGVVVSFVITLDAVRTPMISTRCTKRCTSPVWFPFDFALVLNKGFDKSL